MSHFILFSNRQNKKKFLIGFFPNAPVEQKKAGTKYSIYASFISFENENAFDCLAPRTKLKQRINGNVAFYEGQCK